MGRLLTNRSDDERRLHPRYAVTSMRVDYSDGENFLFAPIANISEMGIFIRSPEPMPVGTRLALAFALEGGVERLSLEGEVTWVNPSRPADPQSVSGMGVRFVSLSPEQREAIVDLVRAVAYLH